MSHLTDFRQVFNQLEQVSEELAKDFGLEHLAGPQGHVLHFLSNNEDQEIFVKDIESKMKISKSVASNLVKRMAKNGFIEIVPSQTDKRYKQVLLSDLGREKLPAIKTYHQQMMDHLFADIPYEDFQTMVRVVEQLKANISTYKETKHV